MNTNYILIYKIILLFLIFFLRCSNETENKIIPPEKFADIYIEINITTGIDLLNDSSYNIQNNRSIIDSILKKNNFTISDFQNTINFYNKNINNWKEFYDNLIVKLERLQATFY